MPHCLPGYCLTQSIPLLQTAPKWSAQCAMLATALVVVPCNSAVELPYKTHFPVFQAYQGFKVLGVIEVDL